MAMLSLGRERVDGEDVSGAGGAGTAFLMSRVSAEVVWKKSSRSPCEVPSALSLLNSFFMKRFRREPPRPSSKGGSFSMACGRVGGFGREREARRHVLMCARTFGGKSAIMQGNKLKREGSVMVAAAVRGLSIFLPSLAR